MDRVAVVTVTYNSATVLADFLRSLSIQRGVQLELIVVDNASDDESLSMVRGLDGTSDLGVHIIRNDTNLGVATANNRGLERALELASDYVAFMNNDTVTHDPHFFLKLIEGARAAGARVVTPFIEATEPPGTIWYDGGEVRPWRGYQVKHPTMGSPLAARRSGASPSAYAPTCCLLVRADVFDVVASMDEQFFVYGDDVDFMLRLRDAGVDLVVLHEVLLLHKASSLTGGFLSDFTVRHLTRNWVLVMRKHASRTQLWVGTAYIQAWIVARALLGKDSPRQFLIRQRAFREAFSTRLSEPAR